jgi:hypothetical protein
MVAYNENDNDPLVQAAERLTKATAALKAAQAEFHAAYSKMKDLVAEANAQFNGTNGQSLPRGDTGQFESPAGATVKERLIAFIRDQPGCTRATIFAALGGNETTIRHALWELVKDHHHIYKDDSGGYWYKASE